MTLYFTYTFMPQFNEKDNIMKLSKFLFVFMVSLLITACGGGGSEQTSIPVGTVTPPVTPPPAQPTLSVVTPDSKNIKETDSYSLSFNIAYTGSEKVEVKINAMTDNVLAVVNTDNVLTVEAKDVNNVDELYSVSITIQAGQLSQSFEQIGTIENTSLLAKIDFVEHLVAETKRFKVTGAQEVIAVNEFLIEQSFLLGNLKESEKSELLDYVVSTINLAFLSIESSTQDLESLRTLYNAQQINEQNVQDYIVGYRTIRKEMLVGINSLNSLYDQYDMADLKIPKLSDVFNEEDMSLFRGNDALGNFVADGWVYSSEYQYLELLIGNNKMNCEA